MPITRQPRGMGLGAYALTQLVWELLTENGHRGADALENGHSEGGPDGQAVDEIVEAIAQGDHPGQGANIGVANAFQPIAGTLGSLQVLRESRAPRRPGQGWTVDLQGRPESPRPSSLMGPRPALTHRPGRTASPR